MNSMYKTHLMAKVFGVLGAGAFVALASLPGLAQSPMNDRNSDRMINQMDRAQQGPSTVPGEGAPGPSESPSGSPSVPGNSSVDDPSLSQPDNSTLRRSEQPMNQRSVEREAMDSNSTQNGSILVPGNSVPGDIDGNTPNVDGSNPGNSSSRPRVLRIPSSDGPGSNN